MSEWKECKLGDVLVFQRGHDLPKTEMVEGNYPVAGSNGIIGFHSKYTTKGPGITIGRSGNIGTPHFYKNNFWAHNTVLYVKDFKGNSEIFLYYFLKTIDFKQFNTGSAVPSLNRNHIHELLVEVPPLSEQKSIASVLSSLDNKIDLLHRQNTTLEKMAETLFRQWFVERCPEPVEGEEKEEWEIKKLGAIAEIQNGFAFSSKDYVEYADTHLEVFKMGHIQKGGGLRTDPKRDYVPRSERLKRWILNKGDIVMAMTDMKDNVVILGVPAMIDKDDNYVLNQRVARIYLKDKSNLISNYLLFIQLKDVDFIQELQSKANSGVQVNLSTESIKDSDIIIPPLAIQKEKSPIIDDLYTKVELNQTQIRTLTALRDTLLPKLMSGEVRVEE
jgi:type I restriction enzyme S subunit